MRPWAILLSLSIAFGSTPVMADEVIRAATPAMTLPHSVANPSALGERFEGRGFARPGGAGLERLLAQGDVSPDPEEGRADRDGDRRIDAQIAALRIERAGIMTRGPRTAAIVGGVLTGVGVVVGATVGLACASANSGSDTTCRADRATGLGVAAGVIAIGGVVTLVTGLQKLRARNARRRAIDREILDLNAQRDSAKTGGWSTKWRADLQLGAEKRFRLSYRF